jgi:GntR family transcriptional regulator, carbon starvation induced regulator
MSIPAIKSLTSQAFERIRNDILLGTLRPNERLKIQALSDRYEIGATAVREALSRLVTDGLVDSEDQKGFCVAPVSKDDLIDLTETRIAIEGMAVRKAIAHGDLEWESQVLSSFHRLSRTPPPTTIANHAAWALAHRQFHESLVAQCGSPWLLRLCGMLYDKSERYRNLAERSTSPKERDTATEHRELMDAIAMERNADKAVALLGAHFRATTDVILHAGFAKSSAA